MKKKTGIKKRGFFAIGLAVSFTIIEQIVRKGRVELVPTLIFSLTTIFTILIIWTLYSYFISHNSNQPVAQIKKRIIPSFLLFVFFTAFISFTFWVTGIIVVYLINGWELLDIPIEISKTSSQAFKYMSIGLLIAYGAFFYTIWHQSIRREQQLREEYLIYKYRNLKSQVNPHFLFNSLNTLSEIIYIDIQKADHYIRKLAHIYRYILEHEETDLVPLEEEVVFIQHYFDLQKERCGDKIKLIINLEDTCKFRVIPVSLQILVENALKHNVASHKAPLVITISNDVNYVEVVNNIQKKETWDKLSGTGLNNLRERTKHVLGRSIILTQDSNQFSVKLPITI